MSKWTEKLTCLLLDHDFETRLVKGKRTIQVGEMEHTYDTINDVKLVCKCCGLVADRELLTK